MLQLIKLWWDAYCAYCFDPYARDSNGVLLAVIEEQRALDAATCWWNLSESHRTLAHRSMSGVLEHFEILQVRHSEKF